MPFDATKNAWAVADAIPSLAVAVDARLSIGPVDGDPDLIDGGTFTITFDGQTTAPIDFDADAAGVTAALEALSTIGAGEATVTVNAPAAVSILFTAGLGARPIAADRLSADGAALTGPDSPYVLAANLDVPGSTAVDGVDDLAAKVNEILVALRAGGILAS